MGRQTEAAGGGREDGGLSPESLVNEWKWSERTRKEREKETSEGQSRKRCLRQNLVSLAPVLTPPPSSCVRLVPYYLHVKAF